MMKSQEDRTARGWFPLHHRSRRAKLFLNFAGTLSPVPTPCPELFSSLYPLFSPCKEQSLGQHVYRFGPDRPIALQ